MPGRAALRAVVNAVRGLVLLPVPGRAEPVLGLANPVRGRPLEDMGRTAGDALPCATRMRDTHMCIGVGKACKVVNT